MDLTSGSKSDVAAMRGDFEARYRVVYGRLLDGIPIRLLNLRLTALARRDAFDLSVLASPPAGGGAKNAESGRRRV